MKNESLVIVAPYVGASNADILAMMQAMKVARESGGVAHVVCFIDGFDEDERDLHEIPEARAFCRRLVDLGFVSWLDFQTTMPATKAQKDCESSLGAFEVWLLAEGRMKNGMEITPALLDEAYEAVLCSNEISDAAIGPFVEPAREDQR